MAVRPSISYIFKDRCSLEVFDWVQTQPGATEVSASADKSLPALYRQPNVSHPPVAPGEITFTLKGGGDVLILTLQRKPSPLTSPCPKERWCGSRVMKGLLRLFDPGASWATPALPGLRNAGPHWLCFLLPMIFTASNASFTCSVLSKENVQELKTMFQKRKEPCIWWQSTNWFHHLAGSDVVQCFLIPTFQFCFCCSLWFIIWVSCTPLIIYWELWTLSKKLRADREIGECNFKGLTSPLKQSLVSLGGSMESS